MPYLKNSGSPQWAFLPKMENFLAHVGKILADHKDKNTVEAADNNILVSKPCHEAFAIQGIFPFKSDYS